MDIFLKARKQRYIHRALQQSGTSSQVKTRHTINAIQLEEAKRPWSKKFAGTNKRQFFLLCIYDAKCKQPCFRLVYFHIREKTGCNLFRAVLQILELVRIRRRLNRCG